MSALDDPRDVVEKFGFGSEGGRREGGDGVDMTVVGSRGAWHVRLSREGGELFLRVKPAWKDAVRTWSENKKGVKYWYEIMPENLDNGIKHTAVQCLQKHLAETSNDCS